MRQHRGNIISLFSLAILIWAKLMNMVDETASLAEVLREYQEDGDNGHVEARLAIALTRVVESSIRPSLLKKLRPQDVKPDWRLVQAPSLLMHDGTAFVYFDDGGGGQGIGLVTKAA